MPIVADWTAIRFPDNSSDPGTYFDPYTVGSAAPLSIPFGTGGLVHNANNNRIDGIITMMVRGLNFGSDDAFQRGTADVRVQSANTDPDGHRIGRLQPYGAPAAGEAEDRNLWRLQQFLVPTNVLSGASSDNANTLILGRVSSGGQFDSYQVRDIVCHFHQNA